MEASSFMVGATYVIAVICAMFFLMCWIATSVFPDPGREGIVEIIILDIPKFKNKKVWRTSTAKLFSRPFCLL
ncbi:hypothetical protein CDI09_14630 [Komagataeibacter nataicola]|uniref:Uncharacterized protein n=1 Tax=Komagataeibacter nataicola TaxID=265960 RepID=A0ABX5P7M4_9PROT|nr:hypothetical protein CDI09_14630 [Komagataeibacter nataicola]